jgi:hypothetical protein
MRMDRRRDGHTDTTKLFGAFRNISNAPKSGKSNYNSEIMEYFCDN